MKTPSRLASLLLIPILHSAVFAQDELRSKPITTLGGKVGDLLKQWWKEGAAAGNVGDFYDNRDGAHSDLNTAPFPQLQRIVYSEAEIKGRLHWAAARGVRPGVVFGNSSTSAPPLGGGSNPRMYYTSAAGLDILYKQFTGNNLYIYPEHRDHDPGRTGPDDGFGDLYPTNTPYLIISQGSSGSDQPFMRAVPLTLAAFRPEVKAKLVETKMLMPTVQMILRSTSKALKHPREYLTGKAHPTVFEGSNVDELAMVKLAHDITLDALPPMCNIEILKEASPLHGRDFFEPGVSEKLADTPCVIARIWRGKGGERTMTISAEKSHDLNKKPLVYHWAVLRGDPERVRFAPQNKEGSVMEITISHHERRPIAAGSAMASNRVDIGVFVHNGVHFSPPAFVTYFGLDNEARTYDDKGRILEIGYGLTEARLDVKSWPALFAAVKEKSSRRKLWALSKDDEVTLAAVEADYAKRAPEKVEADAKVKEEEKRQAGLDSQKGKLEKEIKEALAKDEKEKAAAGKRELEELQGELKRQQAVVGEARKIAQKLQQDVTALTHQPQPGHKRSARQIVLETLEALRDDPFFYAENRVLIEDMRDKSKLKGPKATPAEWQRVIGFGLAALEKEGFVLHPLRPGKGGAAPHWTEFEKSVLRRMHGLVLADVVYPDFLQTRVLAHVLDPRLGVPRFWRDLYRYDDKGRYLGWSRWNGSGVSHYTADGLLILEKDALGRCQSAGAMNYAVEGKRFGPGTAAELRVVPGTERFVYEYESDDDVIGRPRPTK